MKSRFEIASALVVFLSAVAAAAPLTRVPNTTLALPLTPPATGYTYTNAFPGLFFNHPIAIVSAPGETNRLFIVEKTGRIIVIPDLTAPSQTIFLDIADRVISSSSVSEERGLLGLAFHPGYATNGYFYVYYVGIATTSAPNAENAMHDILSRFSVTPSDPNQADPDSELRLLMQYDEANNHNGGDLHFGPDGYLYVSLGDEGGGGDAFDNSQRIDKDFFSGILRLDVDKRPGNLPPNPHPSVTENYLVPADNPFVGATSFNGQPVDPSQVRTEFWAVGLRNPWRMSFDPITGNLYCGDVGQSSREEIDLIVGGGNYGWRYMEGFRQASTPPEGLVHTPPLIDYTREFGLSVTGGRVYRGQRLPELYGAYIYSDYGSGQFWALRHNGTNVTENVLLGFTDNFNDFGAAGVVAFGEDPSNGDLLYADVQNGEDGMIKRIVHATPAGPALPATLADTGAFENLLTLTPHAGIVRYDLNVPFWSDGAHKTRWFSVPAVNLDITFTRQGNYSFPTGSVWIKHFELELTNGVPESRRRLETRFIVKNATGVYGVTYRWGDSTENATLVPEEGMDETFVINDGGTVRTQVWHYPSRAECLQCHTAGGGFALGFNTAQLNREFDYSGIVTNQIAALSAAGYFNTNVTGIYTLPVLAHPTNDAVSLEYRVRSYLAANCAQCHHPGGPAQGNWDARMTTQTAAANIINGTLINNAGNPDARVVAPGSAENSMLLTRMASRGSGQMPPIGSNLTDDQALDLIRAWIEDDLPAYQTFAQWQASHFESTNAPASGPDDDPDRDGGPNYLEYLTGTDPNEQTDVWSVVVSGESNEVEIAFPHVANRGFEVMTKASLLAPWTPLDVPDNRPFFSISNHMGVVKEHIAGTNRFYRVRVYPP